MAASSRRATTAQVSAPETTPPESSIQGLGGGDLGALQSNLGNAGMQSMLDGGTSPSDGGGAPEDGTCGPGFEELAGPMRQRLIEARAQGQQALVAEVRELRAESDGEALTAANFAIEQVLTDEEKAAVDGGSAAGTTSDTSTQLGQQTPSGEEGSEEDKAAVEQALEDAGQCVEGEAGGETTGEEGEQEGGEAEAEGGGAERAAEGGGGGTTGPAPAGPAPAQALQPLSTLPPEGRALVEQELSFHESWQAMQGGTGSRAARLFSGNDLLQGAKGAALQTGVGFGVNQLAQRIPVPGLGNIIGGGLSAYTLWQSGGDMVGSIGEAFNTEGKGGWQIAADVVAGIKSLMDLIGNVCNVLSGLAYAFAAIAAVGGLLSVFFPPLAFLVPYIPTAINFGRACGGIASVCMGVSNLISPIPPVLRAVHILVSDDDPLALAYQEQTYHTELQGAIANYGSAAMDRAIAGQGANPLRQFSDGISGGAGAARSAASDMGNGNAAVRDAFQLQGQGRDMATGGNGRTNGQSYFNTSANAGRQTGLQQEQEQRAATKDAKADRHQARADELTPDNPNASRRQRRPARIQQRKADQNRQLAEGHRQQAGEHEYRSNVARGLDGGNAQGESGNAASGAVDAATKDAPRPFAPVEVQRNERGHVVLPDPPGSLQEIDGIDSNIQQLQQQLAAQQSATQEATAVQGQAQNQVGAIGAVQQSVQGKLQEHAALEAEQARVQAQQADITAQTNAQFDGNQGGLSQAAGVLRPWVGPARTVNGILQQVPSNRFFDVSGTQQSMANFVTGMESVTGEGDKANEQRGQTEQVLGQREQQLSQASDTHAQVSNDGAGLMSQVQGDLGEASAVAAEADAMRTQSSQQEATLEQQIEQARAEREAKWGGLLGWAQQHYATRESGMRQNAGGR